MLLRHEATGARPGRRRGREPRVRRPAALPVSRSPRGREDSGASPACPTRRGGPRCARALGRRRVRWSDENVGLPGHRRRLQRQGHRHEAAGPHRLAVAHGNGESVRDRCRLAGGRRRRPVRLPEERAADGPLRVHSERGGDRRVPARSGRDRVRPEGPLGRARAARHHRPPPGRSEELQGCVPADPPARDGHGSRVGRGEAGHRHEVEDRTPRRRRTARRGPGSPSTTSSIRRCSRRPRRPSSGRCTPRSA